MPAITPEDIQNELKEINQQVQNSINAVNEEVEKHGKIGRDNKQALDNLSNQIEEVTARVLEVEQLGTQQRDVENAIKSVGAQFTDSEAYNNFNEGSTTKASYEAENNLVTTGDSQPDPERRTGVVGGAFRQLRVLDAIPQGNTSSNSVEYLREKVFTNAAAETEEGDFAYPESDIEFELVNAPVRNIGHFIYVTKQMLEDSAVIASYINGRLIYGCNYRQDVQALVGNGTGQNVTGLFTPDNYIVLPGTASGDKQYKNTRRAMAQVALNDYAAEAIFLNPTDCANIDLIEGTDEHFVSANPRLQNAKTLWGLPVIETNAMPSGKYLTGALSQACQWTQRRGVILEMSDSDNDNFTKDMVTIKATCRAAMEVYKPASLVGGDLVIA